jgi:NAD(P)H dehydrogenase (quinone)
MIMYAITGITGRVGGAVAETLITAGLNVRAVVRDAGKGVDWARRGCSIALADVTDPQALKAAFTGVDGVFILIPANFDPEPDFPGSRAVFAALRSALEAARPSRVVCLSTVGAQAKQANLLNVLGIMEHEFGTLTQPVAFLRAAWFMENATWDVAPARETGVIHSFLQPLDRRIPMVATADVGRVAAEMFQQSWTGTRVVELEGPRRVSPLDIASVLAAALGRPVQAQAVLRDSWESLFISQGMKNPTPRIRMLDGFNEGWIDFEGGMSGTLKGKIALETVVKQLVAKSAPAN